MSDSIDRVFSKAISTIKTLSHRSNNGSLPRPSADKRIKLYGLFKQATEGNVINIMPRPQGSLVEDEGAKRKWDAWRLEHGLSMAEAKRQYISFLIDTMQPFARETADCRELLHELEFMWNQIQNIPIKIDDSEIEVNAGRFPLWFSLANYLYPSDRLSYHTPSIMTAQQYQNNMQLIYSHSRNSTYAFKPEAFVPKTRNWQDVNSVPSDYPANTNFIYSNFFNSRAANPGTLDKSSDYTSVWNHYNICGPSKVSTIQDPLLLRVRFLLRFLQKHALSFIKITLINGLLFGILIWWLKRKHYVAITAPNHSLALGQISVGQGVNKLIISWEPTKSKAIVMLFNLLGRFFGDS